MAITLPRISTPEVAPGWRGYHPEDFAAAINEIGNSVEPELNGLSIASIDATFDGGGEVLIVGAEGSVPVPYSATIQGVVVLADQTGSVEFDIKKSSYADYDTMTSIVADAPPAIVSAKKSSDTELEGWTTQITAGDILRFSVTSVTTITWAHLQLIVERENE